MSRVENKNFGRTLLRVAFSMVLLQNILIWQPQSVFFFTQQHHVFVSVCECTVYSVCVDIRVYVSMCVDLCFFFIRLCRGKPANGDYRKDPRERSRSPPERASMSAASLHSAALYAHMPTAGLAMDQPLALTKHSLDARTAAALALAQPSLSPIERQQVLPHTACVCYVCVVCAFGQTPSPPTSAPSSL